MISNVCSFISGFEQLSYDRNDSDHVLPLYQLAALTMAVGLSAFTFFHFYNTWRPPLHLFSRPREVILGKVRESAIPPPTREEFIAAVRAFEKEYKVSLKDILTGRAWSGRLDIGNWEDKEASIDAEKGSIRQAFFTDPIIYNYLTRPSSSVLFLENRPALYSDSKNQDQSDYLECLIYELANPFYRFLPLRDKVLLDTFYFSNIIDPLLFDFSRIDPNMHYRVYPYIISVNSLVDELLIAPQISAFIPSTEQSAIRVGHLYQKARCILFPVKTNDDRHATFVVSIFQDHSHRHLVSIFINSFNPARSRSLAKRVSSLLNERSFYQNTYHPDYQELVRALQDGKRFYNDIAFPLFTEEENEALCSSIEKRLPKDSLYFINEETRTGYLLSDKDIVFPGEGPELPLAVITKAFEEEKIDTFCGVLNRRGCKYYRMEIRPQSIELLDASHHLQVDPKDENCVIYRSDFITATTQLLSDASQSERIYRLAEIIGAGTAQEAKRVASREMHMIFQEELKQFLPQYYNRSGYLRSKAEIKDYHLRRRWDLGNLSHARLSQLGYLLPTQDESA